MEGKMEGRPDGKAGDRVRRLDPVRAAMFGMAAAIVALALVLTSSASTDVRLNVMTFVVCGASLFYILPALIADDVGKAHMDAATAASMALAVVSLAEAFLITATGWSSLVLLAAPFPPVAAGFAVCLMCPHKMRNIMLTVDIAMFGFFVLIPAVTAAFAGHRIIFLLFATLVLFSHLGYIYLLFEVDEYGEEGCARWCGF